jgi:hypothetical protein
VDGDKKEFLLHLYDKLWENMISKEERLWSYLAIYGAGIGLTFGAGKLTGLELYALIFALILTFWAILILINANWWYYRNLLMVTRVEGEFEAALIGVVPKFYRESPRFQFDRLHYSSIRILLLIGALIFSKTFLEFRIPGSIVNREVLASLLFSNIIFILGVFYCVVFHEYFLKRYYDTKTDLLVEAEQKKPAEERNSRETIKESLAEEELKSRKRFNWRWFGVVAILLSSVILDFVARRNGLQQSRPLITTIAIQAAALCLSIYLAITYSSDDLPLSFFSTERSKSNLSLQSAGIMYCLIVLCCIVVYFAVPLCTTATAPRSILW